MTSLLARVGALEARLASQIAWNCGKRKRGDWICTNCRRRGAVKQRRAYSIDSTRITPGLFTPFGLHIDDNSYNESLPRLPNWLRKETEGGARDVEDSEATGEVLETQQDNANSNIEKNDQFWEQLEETEEAESDAVVEDELADSTIDVHYNPLLQVDYASELGPALLQGSADLVARCLLAAARNEDHAFIQTIPTTSFSECIRLLQPSNISAGLTSTHMEISEAVAKIFGIPPASQVSWENGKLLREIKSIRNVAGVRSTLADYRMLLRAARDLGSRPMADNLWAQLLHDGITPDTQCYNHYMAAIVFNLDHSADKRQRHRIIPFHQTARQRPRLGRMFMAYRTGESGLKAKVVRFLNDMLKNGAIANEQSFRIVITALAREGDVATVKSILQRMWDIDVEGLQSGNAKASKPKHMEPGNPLRPSADLLFTVAHAFSINNDVPLALRLVDFIARHYELEISRETWSQLFEWTFVLSIPRAGRHAQQERDGQLPQEAPLNLWNTMTGAPYFIKPTMGMYNHLIKNLQHRDSVPMIYEKIREGAKLQYEAVLEARQAFKALVREVRQLERDPSRAQRVPLETLRRNYENLDLIRKRNHFWARRWMRLLLSTMRANVRVDYEQDWMLRMVPRALWEWNFLAGTNGNNVRYEIPGGQLEFKIRDEEEMQQHRAFAQEKAARTREVLDKVPLLLGDEWVFPKARKDEPSDFAWQRVQ